jgi:exosortase
MRRISSLKKHRARLALNRTQGTNYADGSGSGAEERNVDADSRAVYTTKQLVLAIGLFAGVSLVSYWRTLVEMEFQWRTEPDYSHGYLIVPLAAILLYSRRASFPGFSDRIAWAGLIPICAASSLRIVSKVSYMDFLDGWSMVPWVAGLVWIFAGRKALWWAMPAILFLVLLVPLPYRVETLLSWKLQSVVTLLSTNLLRALGLPAVAEGNTIWIGELQMLIEEACSGLRIFMGMAAFAFFWASMIQRAWVDRIVVLAAALPMAILANTIRVVATCVSFYFLDEKIAAILHDWEGVLMIFLAAGLLRGVMFFWQKLYYPSEIALPIRRNTPSLAHSISPVISPSSSKSLPGRNPVKLHWDWNLPLLFSSIAIVSLLAACLFAASRYRTSKIASQLSQLATKANDAGDFDREVRWLSQLAAVDGNRKDSLVRLAFATSKNATKWEKKDSARAVAMRAIAALDPVEDISTIEQLRRELIPILLDLGPSWAHEVEQQIVLLNAPPGDPNSILWLARCLYAQAISGEWRTRNPSDFQEERDYWKWLACQPIGFILEQAVATNPDSIEVAAALLDTYFFQPDLFKSNFLNAPKDALRKKGVELLAHLRDIDDGLAQWKSYSCEKTIDPTAAREFLATVAPQAIHRLQSSNRNEEYGIVWDIQIVLTQANQSSSDADYSGAMDLYRQLIAIKTLPVPPKLLENTYVGFGQALLASGKIDESLAILKEGCQRIGKNQGLAIFDTYATYASMHADLGEAARALSELSDAINTYPFQSSRVSAPRGEAKTYEQNQINMIKWHADVIRAGYDLRTGNSASAIQKLTAAVATQLQIPRSLRAEASAMLARAYSDTQQWNLAARILEEAVALAPKDRALRLLAAKASERAGASSRAAEHWKVLDDGSFETSLNRLHSIIANLQSVSGNRSDDDSVAQALEQTKLRLLAEKQAGAAPKGEWLLDWLELSMAASDLEIEDGLRNLMHKYPDNATLLSLAIQEFASLDNQAMVAEAMKMLEKLQESNPSLWLQSSLTHAIATRDLERAAQIVKQSFNDPLQANVDVLAIVLRSLETRSQPDDVWTILRPHMELADKSKLFTAGQLLIELESKKNQTKGAGESREMPWDASSDLDGVIERLDDLEGASGTLALLLKANRLMERFVRTRAPEDLRACAELHAEIESRRPRWSMAMALAGRIADAQGKPERAVECFRLAIADGDNRVATILELVQQLNLLGYYEEAEFEFQKVAAPMGQAGQLPEQAYGPRNRARQVKRRLEMARADARSRPGDIAAWLNLFQTVQLQLLAPDSDYATLINEADNAIDQAIDLTGRADSQLWRYKIRFASRYCGIDVARSAVNELLASSVPEKNRILMGALALIQLQDMDRAKEILDASIARDPNNVEIQLAIVEYYRAVGDQAKVVAALEEAVRLAPSRVDIKNTLAMALATNDVNSASLPWERIASLVSVEEKGSNERNQLFHAILLASRGGEDQTQQARSILRGLIDGPESKTRDDALRYSIILDQGLWKNRRAAGDEQRAREVSLEIQQGFHRLTKRRFPAAMDLSQYVDFLLASENVDEVPELLDGLETLSGISEQTLAFRIRLAHARREPDRIREIIRQTIATEHTQNRRTRILKLSEILIQHGLKDETIRLLRSAYEQDPAYLRALVDGLTHQGEFQKGLEVCLERAKIDNSPDFLSVFADCWTERREWDSNAETIDAILERGLKAQPNDASILESVGSLRLSQCRYEEAFQLLETANRLSPDSLLTMNNLAIAASEIPGKEEFGLAMIERAIAKFGRIPDLIDTRGLVQLQRGSYRKARESFDEAFALRADPRFRLHRVQVDLAESIELDPEKLSKTFDFKSLQTMKLTPREKAVLDQLLKLLENKMQVIF